MVGQTETSSGMVGQTETSSGMVGQTETSYQDVNDDHHVTSPPETSLRLRREVGLGGSVAFLLGSIIGGYNYYIYLYRSDVR